MTSTAPPTEFFPGINFNASFYNLGSSAVSLEYLQSNFLRSTGYAISRAQYTLFNGSVNIQQNLDVSQNINASAYLLNGVPFTPSQWTTSGNDIYYNTGNVGIGKTNPSATYKLDVSGNINADKFFRAGTELTQYTDTNVRTVLSTSAGTNMTWNNTNNTFNVGIGIATTAALGTVQIGSGLSINGAGLLSANVVGIATTAALGTVQIGSGLSITPQGLLSANAVGIATTAALGTVQIGSGLSITPQGLLSANTPTPYTLPTATNIILGGVKSGNDISVNPTTGIMSLSGNDIYLNGTTNREYGWANSNSALGRAATNQAYSSSSLINDVVLRSANNLILQSGTTTSALIINTINQAIFRNSVGVGLTTILAGTIFDVAGILKIATDAGADRLSITSSGVQVKHVLTISGSNSSLNQYGALIRLGGWADDSSADLCLIQNREYAINKGELLLFRGDNIEDGTTGVDRIRLRSGAIAFDTYPATSTSASAENIRMYIDGNGNVGINNTAPTATLDVIGNVKMKNGRVAIQSSGFAIDNNYMSSNTLTIGNHDLNYGGGQQWNSNTAGLMFECRDHTEIAVHDSGDSVHSFLWYYQNAITIGRNMGWGAPVVNTGGDLSTVGAASIGSSLSVAGTSFLRNTYIYSGNEGTSIALYFATPFTGSVNGATKSAIIAQAVSSYSRHNLSFCLNIVADNTSNVTTNDAFITLTYDGWISTNRPFRFATNIWHVCIAGFRRVYYSPAGEGVTYYSGGNSGGANARTHEWRRTYDDAMLGYIENTGLLRTYGYSSLSDTRIKKNIRDIDDTQGLEKILLIQPKKYNYIEKERNKHDVIGFIAQQIAEVIPEAITKTEGIVPNIYKNCLVNNKREIYYSLPSDVEIDTDVIITDTEDGTGERYKIKEIYDNYFVIDKDIERDVVFVKGYSINDLHNLDKNYIYTLNVCATQELYKLIMEQREEINNLKNRLSTLENINNCQ